MNVRLDHVENQGILKYLGVQKRFRNSDSTASAEVSYSPDSVKKPYTELGVHPDLVSRLWDEITSDLPERCAWIIRRTPVLVQPTSGIIFGFCGGTHTYALRLPQNTRAEAIERGAKTKYKYSSGCLGIGSSKLDLKTIGEDWILGDWHKEEKEWCLHAFNYAEELGREKQA